MKIRHLLRVRVRLLPGIIFLGLLWGCAGSDRTIHLADKDITTGMPIQLDRDMVPIAASRDGRRVALAGDIGRTGKARIVVVDTDSQARLGETEMPNSVGTPMFSLDGSTLYVDIDEGNDGVSYGGWNYAKGTKSKVRPDSPMAKETSLADDNGWNQDRTIAISYPEQRKALYQNVARTEKEPGQIAVTGGLTFDVATSELAGFDEYGNAWVGSGEKWTKIDKSGHVSKASKRPKVLAHDQTKDRGSLHLRATSMDFKHEGAKAHVSCIWLSSDRAVPILAKVKGKVVRVNESYKSALVFAGPDILDYGFLPGRDMVYVVSMCGSYLVPFSSAPHQGAK